MIVIENHGPKSTIHGVVVEGVPLVIVVRSDEGVNVADAANQIRVAIERWLFQLEP